jgi:hypothetical protein
MPLLYHWRGETYRRDLADGLAFHLNQGNPLLHRVERGDSVWAFTRGNRSAPLFSCRLLTA